MSASTTLLETRAFPYHTLQIIQDYDLVRTGDEDHPLTENEKPQQQTVQPATVLNPQNWTTDHRRMPEYRPINYNLDRAYIGQAQNTVEYVFINVMFHGVNINANMARLWRNTLGRVNPNIFRYSIGGEW